MRVPDRKNNQAVAGPRRATATRRATRLLALVPLVVLAGAAAVVGPSGARAADIGQGSSSVQSANQTAPDSAGVQSPNVPHAGPLNGSFEQGLSDWATSGNVDALQDTDFNIPIPPTDLGTMALLCNGPGSINPAELDNLDTDPGPNNDNDRSTLQQTFTLTPGEVPSTLSFDWAFITAEGTVPPGAFDDFFRVMLSGPGGGLLLAGSAPQGGVSPFPDVGTDGIPYSVLGGSTTTSCNFANGRSQFEKFLTIIDTPGTYILEFLVSDQGNLDHAVDSGLLIDNVQLTPEIDLEITKTASPSPAIAGAALFYDITVTNHGSGNATDVIVTDTLPVDVVFAGDTNVPPCIESPVGTVACQLGDLGGGATKQLTLKTVVNSAARSGGSLDLQNDAVVDSDNPDRDPENNAFSLRTVLEDESDLLITKVSVPDLTVQALEVFTYTIYVDNLGPSAARNVTLIDDILASGTFSVVSDLGADQAPGGDGALDPARNDICSVVAGEFGEQTIRCELNEALEPQSMAPGNGRWTIELMVRPDDATDIQNLVRVFSEDPDGAGPLEPTDDPDFGNNTADDFIAVTTASDLNITKIGRDLADGDLQVVAGGSVIYTIRVTNDGPSTAENVTVIDMLPTGLVDGSLEGNITTPSGGGICTVGTSGDPDDPMICQAGDLAPGEAAVVIFMGDVDPSFVANQPETTFANYLHNDAHVTADTFDPDTLHNRVSDAFVEVLGEADLAVEKEDLPDPVRAGEVLTYRIRVTNNGPSTAEGVVIDDDLPAGTTFLSAPVLGGVGSCEYNAGNRRVRCNLDDMVPSAVVEILVVVLVESDLPDGTVLTNTVRRNATLTITADPNQANDEFSTDTTVIADADVEIEKMVEPVKIGAGEQVKYTIWARNYGPSDAQDVVIFDVLPDEVLYEVDTNSPMCTQPGNLVGFRTELAGDNEVPPVASEAMGLATLVLDTATNLLRYSIEPTDIEGISGAHLHLGSAGVNGPVTQFLYGGPPPGFAPTEPIVGSITLTPAEAAALLADPAGTYVNVHTASAPAGEIRGQLAQTVNTPVRCEVGTLPAPTGPREPEDAPSRHHFDMWALVLPDAPPGEFITNVAIITSPTEPTVALPAPNGTGLVPLTAHNDVASIRNYIEGKADLRILKFGKRDERVRAGEVLTYTVIVDNFGPSAAQEVAVKDVLQSSGVFDLIDIISDRDARCVGLPGPNPAVDIAGTPWPPLDPPPLDGVNLPTGVEGIDNRLEIDCTLFDGDDPTTPDENEGALDVLAADGPPNTGRWMLTVRVRADEEQDINNLADVVSETPDPNIENNHAEVEHTITDVSDLAVTKSAVGELVVPGCPPTIALTPDEVTAGRSLTYTIDVTNFGPSTAENVVVFDRLPPGVTVTSAAVTAGVGSCSTGTAGSPADRLTCGLGTMLPRSSKTITVVADVHPSLVGGTILENDVLVVSDVFDPTNENDYATNLTTVSAAADLVAYKSDNPNPVTAGELLEYTITVANEGPSDAVNVVVTDTLPFVDNVTPGVSFVRIRDPFGHGVVCSLNPIDEHTLTCTIGDIPAGDDATFTIVVLVHPNAQALLPNTVTTASDTPDPCELNNSAGIGTGVDREDMLFIRKSDQPDPIRAGKEITYTVTFGNNGPSTATTVRVTDTLPLGIFFDRCESLDPNDSVRCSVLSGDGETSNQIILLEEILEINQVVFRDSDAPNDELDPGEFYTYKLIAEVGSGYILNGHGDTDVGGICRPFFLATDYPYYSHNRIDIASDQDAAFDDECTKVESEADIQVQKFDDLAGFLQCDPVAPGGTITYDIIVTNNGPSDGAQVYLVDWLPREGVALDPAVVEVDVSRGEVVEIRDDGRLTILVGDDPNHMGERQLGRMNPALGPVEIQIRVKVWEAAECESVLTNQVSVESRRNDTMWPPLFGSYFAPTPTYDPDLTNNADYEETTVQCPSIDVTKTVSFDGTCPGRDIPEVWNETGQPVTFCFEITNGGTTYLDSIAITDTLRTRTGTTVVFTDTITYGIDENVPVAPGETVLRQVTVQHLTKECGTADDTIEVSANPTNSGRTDLACLPLVTASDTKRINVPCAGVDTRLVVPALSTMGLPVPPPAPLGLGDTINQQPDPTAECESWIQVQNLGDEAGQAMLVVWGPAGFCPPQSAGPLKIECTGLLRPGAAWSFAPELLPKGAESGIVYSLNANDLIIDSQGVEMPFADLACLDLFRYIVGDYDQWLRFDRTFRERQVYRSPFDQSGLHQLVLDFGEHQGEPMAVTVNRTCPDPTDPNASVSAAYSGISSDAGGMEDPFSGGYMYYAPMVFADMAGLNSWINIQNVGTKCTSLELWFKAQDNCLRPILGDVLAVAPGESVRYLANTVAGPDWLGSAWIRASQPLGIVIDTMGKNHFTSYNGVPGDVYSPVPDATFSLGTQVNYAPLIYNQHQGWDTALVVQNLSSTMASKVKVYFLDRSGGIEHTMIDWICPRGSQTFFLPVIDGMPGNWVGSARVESQEWWTPGDPLVDPPRLHSVVLLEKWADPARSERREAMAYNTETECDVYDWQLGAHRGGQQSGSAVLAVPLVAKDNRGITTEMAITNLVPKPGFTDFAIFLYDQNGLLDYVCEKLNEKQVEYIDVSTWGWVHPRFLGSAVISAVFWEHDVFDAQGGFERNLVGLGGVIVERIGGTQGRPDVPGDESKAVGMFPVFDFFHTERATSCPGVP